MTTQQGVWTMDQSARLKTNGKSPVVNVSCRFKCRTARLYHSAIGCSGEVAVAREVS